MGDQGRLGQGAKKIAAESPESVSLRNRRVMLRNRLSQGGDLVPLGQDRSQGKGLRSRLKTELQCRETWQSGFQKIPPL